MRIISGAYKGRTLKTVSGPGYRPAMARVRESLFSLLESRGVVWSAERVLDLFAGSGSLGFEALSRGAQEVMYVESDVKAAQCIERNATLLGVEGKVRVSTDDVLRFTARRPHQDYGVIFIDPPYSQNLFPLTLRNIMRNRWLGPEGFVVAEVEKHLRLSPTLAEDNGLAVNTDRLYGQTRILIWEPLDLPSTPEPLIP